jgi:hypothetical protein
MAPIYPSFPEQFPDVTLQAARALVKLILEHVSPEEFCRAKNTTLEQAIIRHLRFPATNSSRLNNNTTCQSRFIQTHPNVTSSLPNILTTLARCAIPPLAATSTPTRSPTPSPTASISVSATPSPSSPVPMCGDKSCKERGIDVHIYRSVPPGWCTMCLEGTSGPCRDESTFACFDYSFSNVCNYNQIKCEDFGLQVDPHLATPECNPHTETDVPLSKSLLLPTPISSDWVNVWGRTFASSIADVTGIENLCDIRIASVTEQRTAGNLVARILVYLYGQNENEAHHWMNLLIAAEADGSLVRSMKVRGMEITSN